MVIKSYEDLVVWQKAIDLTVEIYRLVKFLPREENLRLVRPNAPRSSFHSV